MKFEFTYAGKKHKLDFFTFAKRVLGYTLLEEYPHRGWCNELEKRHSRFLLLQPRHTYKSTLLSKALPIWRLFENPNLRILLAGATAKNVQNFLGEISGQYLRNPKLIALYQVKDHIRPLDPLAEKKEKITISTRTLNQSEASITTTGSLANLVSAHYDMIIADDLCNADDRESPTIRAKRIRWFQDLVSVLSPDGELLLGGTRWHFDDAYGYVINKLNPALPKPFKYKMRINSCYMDDGNTPSFPRILSAERLEALKIEKGPMLFACNYLNKPMSAEAQVFHLEDMHTIDKGVVDLMKAKAFGFCDPSGGVNDYSAIVTLLLLPDNTWLVFACHFSHAAHSKLIDEIVKSHAFFKYEVFGIEGNNLKAKSDSQESNFERVLRAAQEKEKVTVPYKLIWHTIPKQSRIRSIEPYYVNGQLKFVSSWNSDYSELITEFTQFPLAMHDDGPDALEGAIKLILDQPVEQPILIPRAH